MVLLQCYLCYIKVISTMRTSKMSSFTSSNQQSNFHTSRVVPNVIVSCLLAVALWITVSLIHFGIKTGKWRTLKKEKHVDKLNIGHIYTSVVVCGLMGVFYDAIVLVYMNTGFATNGFNLDEYCDSLSDLAYSAYALTIFTTTIVLWLRQIIFFQNRILNVNYNKCVKVLSALSLFLILVTGIATLFFNNYPDNHIATMDGCVYKAYETLKIRELISIILFVAIYQSLLLGLFVYAIKATHSSKNNVGISKEPRWNRRQVLQRSASNGKLKIVKKKDCLVSRLAVNKNVISKKNFSFVRNQKISTYRLMRLILIKTVAVAVTTTMLDFLMLLFIKLVELKPHEHCRYSAMFGSFNAFLHLFLTVLSFSQWRKMLTSFC